MHGNSNLFVLQLYYNIVNSLGVQIFAKEKQINNMCIRCVSASIIGECGACERCWMFKDPEFSPSCSSMNQLEFCWKQQGNGDVTDALAKLLTLSKQEQSEHIYATYLYVALLSPHQCGFSSCSAPCLNPRKYFIKCHQINHYSFYQNVTYKNTSSIH